MAPRDWQQYLLRDNTSRYLDRQEILEARVLLRGNIRRQGFCYLLFYSTKLTKFATTDVMSMNSEQNGIEIS